MVLGLWNPRLIMIESLCNVFKSVESGSRLPGFWILVLTLTSCVTLGKLFNLSVHQFLHPQSGDGNKILKKLQHVKVLRVVPGM